MSKRPYFGPSEAQANADALANRGRTYADPNAASFKIQWDWHRREPRDLREAVNMVRKAYQDEVPTAIHEGPDSIGGGGTPKYRKTFLLYLEAPEATDAGKGEDPGWAYHLTPFKATLAAMSRGDLAARKQGEIVSRIAIGLQGPKEAAIAVGVPNWCAGREAEAALRAFRSGHSDIRLSLPKSLPKEDAAA